MIQTILVTALSAQLTLKPTDAPTPSLPQVVKTQVLTDKDYVNFVVEHDYKSYTLHVKQIGESNIIPLPELQKDIVSNDKLVQPTTITSSSPASLVMPTVLPTVEPTVEPTTEPTVVAPVVTQPVSSSNSSISDEAINYLGSCEAGMNPTRNSGNGYYGAFQFSYGTWKSMNTGYERADLAPIDVQIAAVKQLLQKSSIYNQFPGCAAKMRSAGLI
jgi:Transglycosylase-like domain